MSEDKDRHILQFVPFLSTIESGFWTKLAEAKLNIFKLDDSRKVLNGFYTNSDTEGLPCRHSIDFGAFEMKNKAPPLCFSSHGGLHNKNTIEDFKSCDKKAILEEEAKLIWNAITSGEAILSPDLLVRFLLLSFADLKKFMFYYWFAFPAFVHSVPVTVCHSNLLSDVHNGKFMEALQNAVQLYRKENQFLPNFFIICSPTTLFGSCNSELTMTICKLKDFELLYQQGHKIIFAYCDPSTIPGYPGWPLRNYLSLIAYHWSAQLSQTVDIICYRDRPQDGKRNISHSLCFSLNVSTIKECPLNSTGWEKNKANKYGPRRVDLAEDMDPVKLAESSVNLNLKLMKWRLMPSLDLKKISSCKCLLLGAGTLGCNIARALLGWGVTNITLVDYGTVAFSNPVRQTLFEFSDCSTAGGKSKAPAAAERLKKIFPGVNAEGIELSIPMPGHPISDRAESVARVKKDVNRIENLVDSHDVIYLLMDTRESRWLPTLLATVKRKFVINVALGFDSYLVMRHGMNSHQNIPCSSSSESSDQESKLGCYFCNDVVAPGNSMKDRTLDQQCTVSRPGVSMIASALAVELMASILQHPHGPLALPNPGSLSDEASSCLGPVPHQIRGFLSHNQIFYPTTEAYGKCTGCSDFVVSAYKEKGFQFLLEVFNSPHDYLEDLTGLTLLYQQTASAESEMLEFSDSESI
ncbi:ubiquitin-like modifier-activating enzyme ATG7 isoform X1 [Clavelina lepadiformis]|uniref:ubiquitin-like modifier-activating enzyme ATG7 isoform X1 n=2 Tax=Clavelina lepadiformis TaxID=159417 RepID=UPI004041D3A3